MSVIRVLLSTSVSVSVSASNRTYATRPRDHGSKKLHVFSPFHCHPDSKVQQVELTNTSNVHLKLRPHMSTSVEVDVAHGQVDALVINQARQVRRCCQPTTCGEQTNTLTPPQTHRPTLLRRLKAGALKAWIGRDRVGLVITTPHFEEVTISQTAGSSLYIS